MKLLLALLLALPMLAQATCYTICEDSDEGSDVETAGIVTQVVRCSPPGGPVHETVTTYEDRCEGGMHREMICDGLPGLQTPHEIKLVCRECSDTRPGVCLSLL